MLRPICHQLLMPPFFTQEPHLFCNGPNGAVTQSTQTRTDGDLLCRIMRRLKLCRAVRVPLLKLLLSAEETGCICLKTEAKGQGEGWHDNRHELAIVAMIWVS